MHHTGISLACQTLGIPAITVAMMLLTLQQIKYYIKTGHGESEDYYSAEGGDPFQGGCQGNGAAPGYWIAESRILLRFMTDCGHTTTITTAMTLVQMTLVSFMFVDDKELITMAVQGDSHQTLIRTAQHKLTNWQKGLEVTGGALKREKCYWYLVTFKWRAGRWLYGTETDFPGDLHIEEAGQQRTIQRL